MIQRDEVMPLLLKACPSFASEWAVIEDEHRDEASRIHYWDAGDFARHLVELLKRGEVREISAAFEVIERLHTEGDDYVKELATIGYLEGIQNVAGWDDRVGPEDFEPCLGPQSSRWWRGLNAFWSGEVLPPVRPID